MTAKKEELKSLDLEELKSLRELNELDLLYKLRDKLNSNLFETRIEETVQGITQAGLDIRKYLTMVKVYCDAIRDRSLDRYGAKRKSNTLEKAIAREQENHNRLMEKKRKLMG